MEKRPSTFNYRVITQVILLRLKANTTDHALAIFKAVQQTQSHIPCLVAVVTGENQSEAHRGFTHGIFLYFDHDPQEAKAHPKYQVLLTKALSLCEQVVTFELPQTLPVPNPASLAASLPAAPAETAPSGRGRPRKAQPAATPRPPQRSGWKTWSADPIDERLRKIVVEQLGLTQVKLLPTPH